MSSKPKSVQIRLRHESPIEKSIIDYLNLLGERTGIEKQQFIKAMRQYMIENPIEGLEPIAEPKPERKMVEKVEEKVETPVKPIEEEKPNNGYSDFETTTNKAQPVNPKSSMVKTDKIDSVMSFGLVKG